VRVRAVTDAIARRLSTLEPAEGAAEAAEGTTGEVTHSGA